MKKLITLLLFITSIMFANNAHAQLRKIPAEVTNTFTEKFPEATNIVWQDRLVDFNATFNMNSTTYHAKFSNDGIWKSTEEEINEDALNDDVKDGYAKSQYTNWEIKSVAAIELPENETQYRITVAKNNINKKNLLFDENGKLLKDNFTF